MMESFLRTYRESPVNKVPVEVVGPQVCSKVLKLPPSQINSYPQVSLWPPALKDFAPEHVEYWWNSKDGILDSTGVKKPNAEVRLTRSMPSSPHPPPPPPPVPPSHPDPDPFPTRSSTHHLEARASLNSWRSPRPGALECHNKGHTCPYMPIHISRGHGDTYFEGLMGSVFAALYGWASSFNRSYLK